MKKKDPTSHRIIEKRRRDRMNNCLADLSKLIPAHYMKKGRGRVEKTEIIEMAIRHLKDLIEANNNAQQIQQIQQPNPNHNHNNNQQHRSNQDPSSQIQLSNESYHIRTILNPSPEINDLVTRAPAPVAPTTTTTASQFVVTRDIQKFSDHTVEIIDYINNHHQEIYQNNNNDSSTSSNNNNKVCRSSPSPSSNGSDSGSSCSSSSCSSGSCIKTNDSCCGAWGPHMLGGSDASRTSGSLSDGGSSRSGGSGSNTSRSTSAWYKKRWLARSFSRSTQR